MSRNKDYQRLLNDKRWRVLRASYLQAHPLCERCLAADGHVAASVDCHHKTPVESAHSLAEMEALCYNPDNLQALCIPCHKLTHEEMRSNSRDGHKQRESDRLSRWIAKHEPCQSQAKNVKKI